MMPKQFIFINLEEAVETTKYAKYAKGQGVARNLFFTGKETLATTNHEPFQCLFSRGSRISWFRQLPFQF